MYLQCNFDWQMYDHVASTEITLVNTGKVGFEFCCLNLDPALAKKPKPGVPIMVPHAVSSDNNLGPVVRNFKSLSD